MSLRLKRSVEMLLGVALAVAILAVLPGVAEAQDAASVKDDSTRIVVSPGDSLWSISEARLGPNASPQRIANGVERIYALNRNRIGGDPNLIFPGQKLLLPAVGEPSRAEPSTRAATPTRGAAKPADTTPTGRAAKSETDRVSSTAVGEAERKAGRASDPVAQPVALPNMPAGQQDTPKVGSPSEADAAPSLVESFGKTARSLLSSAASAVVGLFPQADHLSDRKLLGLGIIVLTLLVAGLMAWKLPLRRNVEGAEVWGIPTGYAGYYADPSEDPDRYENTPGGAPASPVVEPDPGSFEGEAPATGAHNPEVRSKKQRTATGALGRR